MDSPFSTTPKRTLRRKPPPIDMTGGTGKTDSSVSSTKGPDRFNSVPDPLLHHPQSPYNQMFNTPTKNYGTAEKPNQLPGITTNIKGPQTYYELILSEDEILNMEISKPMGPKELPEYELHTGIGNVSGNYDEDFTPPYPVDDSIDHIFNGTAEYDSPFNNRTLDILNQSLITPTKIPTLANPTTLSPDQIHDRIPRSKYNEETSRSGSPSPTRYNTYNGRAKPHDSSFARSQTLSVPRRPSPERLRGSRSPSPKKQYGRSPSLMYGDFDEREERGSEQENEDYDIEDVFQNYNEVEDVNRSYEVYDDENHDYYDDELESPASKLFDFSILPELPSATTSNTIISGSANSPTKRMTLNSAISFVKDPYYFDDQTGIVPRSSMKKKNDELPPVPLDLPKLPFTSSSLVSRHFAACNNVWSLSQIFDWCLKLKVWLHDLFILKKEFKKALIKLLVYHKRDVPLETLAPNVDQIISTLSKLGAIRFDYGTLPNDDGEKPLPQPNILNDGGRATKENPGVELFENINVSGVLIELTDCYCYGRDHSKLKDEMKSLRCLSSRCYINRILDYEIKFKNSNINEITLGEDWASHWKLTAEDIKSFDKNMAKRQSLLFDLLRYEQTFIQRATVFIDIVAPEFIKVVKILIGSLDIILTTKFDDDILIPSKELITIHQKSLFEPLLKILISNGKFIKDIVDIGNIYYNWSQVVKPSLLKYIGTVPMIEELMRIPNIKQWIDTKVRDLPKVKQLKVNGALLFMSTFNTRYQQLPLQLSDIRKLVDEQDPEYGSLTRAIEGIKKTSSKVNEMKQHADNIHLLRRIQKQLIWGKNILKTNINFNSTNRKFFYRGDLTRKGDLKINSSVNHVILLDNYLIITERLKNNKYRVNDLPIPIEFLIVELKEKESPTIELNNITKLTSSLPQSPKHELMEEDTSIFPFKIRYAGQGKTNSFTFSTKSERDRNIWIDYLIKAKTNLSHRLNRIEPYRSKLISHTCFAYEESNKITKLPILNDNDPIAGMANDSLKILEGMGYKGPDIYNFNSHGHVVFGTVLSANSIFYNNVKFIFIGTTTGVYCTNMNLQWKRIVSINDTTKISILLSMNLVIMLSGGYLKYYPLDTLIKFYYGKKDSISSVLLSNDIVSFFEIDIHREIIMLFFAKKKSNSSGSTNFKVCIPEVDNNGIFNSFKVVKRFYVQAECHGISIFNTSFAVFTNKGIEILELDKLLPRSIPEIPFNDKKIDGFNRKSLVVNSDNNIDNLKEIEVIRKLIYSNSKPLGMFKLNNNSEFLLVYNEFAIFINKHGKLSRFTILKFDYKAKSIRFFNNHLFIICEEVIEIWSISDFVKGTNRLIQVLIGKDIKVLNDDKNLIFSLANPLVPGLQLIFNLYNKDV